jgi:hypothetical protein
MDQQTKLDIALLHKARQKIEAIDKAGDPLEFNDAGLRYGSTAHRVYIALDVSHRSCECYHDKNTKRVLLDAWTVLNRTRSFKTENISIDDLKFWEHADMVKTLCDYLYLAYPQEIINAST